MDPEVCAQLGTGGVDLPPVPAGQGPPETRIEVAIHVNSQNTPTVHFPFPSWALVFLGELHHQGTALLGDGGEAEGDYPLPVLLGALLQQPRQRTQPAGWQADARQARYPNSRTFARAGLRSGVTVLPEGSCQ